jgi:pimeloyl-ACP methyl ester carboxylesterase
MLTWLTDQLVLCPSTNRIETEYLIPEEITTPFGTVEAWYCDSADGSDEEFDAHAIKFPGAGGRAERSSPHPFELWKGANVRVWTINQHGYGNSTGTASLQTFAETCDSVWEHITHRYSPRTTLLVGNSLGCVSALYLAARFPVNGVFLRNPVPLSQVIRSRPRYNWWNGGAAKWIARQIPAALNAVDNAAKCTCPAVFVQSERDRLVPLKFQNLILEPFAGPKNTFIIHGANHHHKIPTEQEDEYLEVVSWFRERVGMP